MELGSDPRALRKLHIAARRAARHLPGHLPPVLVFTDPARSGDLLALASAMPRGWGLVYRHFGDPDALDVAKTLSKLAGKRRFRLLIGADPELARKVGADGVHWPQRLARQARLQAQRFALNTMSAHSARDLRLTVSPNIHARVLSTVFASASPSAGPPMGAIRARRAAKGSALPVYGLGGVSAATAMTIADRLGLAGVGRRTLQSAPDSELEG